MSSEPNHSYRFKSFLLDVEDRQLLNNDSPVPLTPKVFDVLVFLVQRAGHLVEKEELMQTVWADAFVEDANLSRAIHTLRRSLGENQNGNKFIATVAKKGYRFVADVKLDGKSESKSAIAAENGSSAYVWPDELEVVHAEPGTENAASPVANRKPSTLIVFACLALILAGSLAAFIVFKWNSELSTLGRQPVSIAVLPFRPVNAANEDNTYDLNFAFSLILRLDLAKNLKVRSFRATKDYTGEGQDAAIVGKEQKVDYVVQSSYMVAGGKLRVTSDLYNVKTGTVDATLNHDGPDSDLFAAGDIVASIFSKKLLAALNVEPVEPMANRGTKSEEAWKHYVYGTMLNNKRIREDSLKAVTEFENAVRIDPDFAEAYVGLAHAHEASFVNGGSKTVHCSPWTQAVDRAIALAPNLGDAYTMKARNVRTCFGDAVLSSQLFDKAVELTPNSAFVRRFRGIHFMNQGRSDEALTELETALDLDPNLPWTEKLIARALYFARRYDAAIEQLKKTIQLDRHDPEQPEYLMMCYAFKGDFEQAFEWFLVLEATKNTPQTEIDFFKRVYSESAWPGVLRARLERAEKGERTGDKNYGELASLAAQLGENDKAFTYLGKRQAGEKVEPTIGNLRQAPTFDSLRSDPRFERLLASN